MCLKVVVRMGLVPEKGYIVETLVQLVGQSDRLVPRVKG